MGITAISGPHVSYGITTTSSGGTTEYNEERAPSVYDLGQAIMDPRPAYNYKPGAAVGTALYGLWDNAGYVDAVPSLSYSSVGYIPGTIVSCLYLSSQQSSGYAVTLNTTVSSATGQWLNQTLFDPYTGGTYTANMVTDLSTTSLTFGSGATVTIWNPNNAIARCIAVAGTSGSSQDDSNATVTVTGRDIYGFKMSETITMSSLSRTTPAIGRKAFKVVQTVTINNSSQLNSSNINIAFSDKFGFPVRVDTPMWMTAQAVSSNSSSITVITASLGLSWASTATATATTSDVRGTLNATAASVVLGGNLRLQMYCNLNPVNLATITSTNYSGIFGVPQFGQ